METVFVYLVKANAALVLFYLLYVVFLRKDTFFRLKRHFFLAAIIFSLVYPFFAIDALGGLVHFPPKEYPVETSVSFEEPMMDMVLLPSEGVRPNAINWLQIVALAMAAGSAALALRLCWQIGSIVWLWHKSRKMTVGDTVVRVLPGNVTPFSFFKWIFLSPETHSDSELQQILLHEQSHARQWHSADIMLAEWLCVVFWWNPAVWMMKRETAINLEYLADNCVLRTGVNSKEYQYHLLRLTYQETAVLIVNNFNVSQLKQRIMMMNKSKSPTQKLTKYLMILPVAFLFVAANSIYAEKTRPADPAPLQEQSLQDAKQKKISSSDEVFTVVQKQPSFVGGQNAMMEFLKNNLVYPKVASENGIQGRVNVSYIIEKDGSISNVTVVRGVDPSLDKAAVDVVKKMPKWNPGEQNDQLVRVRYTLPVVFRLPKTEVAKAPPSGTANAKSDQIESASKDGRPIFTVVEQQPEFIGGTSAMMDFLRENIKYPAEAAKEKIQGHVICNFVVEKNGSISDVNIVRSANPLLDAEAVRVIKSMPDWNPGKQRGQAVRVRFTLPVVFGLPKVGVAKAPPSGTANAKSDQIESASKDGRPIFTVVEQQPEFIGGTSAMLDFLKENIKYPAEAAKEKIQGRVICNFVVEENGSISDVNVVLSVNPLLNAEAVRVIKSMPDWNPGKQRGQAVRVRFTLPVVFSLATDKPTQQ